MVNKTQVNKTTVLLQLDKDPKTPQNPPGATSRDVELKHMAYIKQMNKEDMQCKKKREKRNKSCGKFQHKNKKNPEEEKKCVK